ncbi:hypothetical protein [Pontibacter actiniarum]|uniref:Uncharacterized protein n=1 Tax=Pontibacter actiniarum TaxID=323450 RepID=A0A1X9YTT2_9BACT|nr:hypothetical protein [Pontibacter actiniarum]ARS36252.1 hypothetical protein CA264_12850 [Pontibacter actiniarum]
MRSFYDFNRSIPREREEQYNLYPEMALYHIALREELGEEEYNAFYSAEKEAQQRFIVPMYNQTTPQWTTA